MGHGKNKQQKVGMGQEPKETKEQKRQRLADEAKAREACMKIFPYVLGGLVFTMLAFSLWVSSLPPKIPAAKVDQSSFTIPKDEKGMSFEEALAAQTDQIKKEELAKLLQKVKEEIVEENDQAESVINLDGDSL
ncbi:hypothetical protein HJC23_000148 [Cyclotella cryptica]|uniref:Uncharacterized protein n=1 Tax=Cyclotella cryptica TaxID=29204 RepID=A0ABD3PKM0_9STRA|eukprot:CCRYP_014097-RA/>CCRYP_014097-RA protein AED:0.36 eAED:0.36 QI:216/1/1/1/1/1/2/442/133